MRCPFCMEDNDRVIDSRPNRENTAIRRRRMCNACTQRFTTYEYIEQFPIQIVKKDGRREDFQREKILRGLALACRKRSVPLAEIERSADDIYETLMRAGKNEVPSAEIGELIMERLEKLDQVAFVRFASVYRDFKDLGEFRKAIDRFFKEEGRP